MNEIDTILMYGAMWCSDCRRAKQFFTEHNIPYEWIDITDNDEAIAIVEEANHGGRSIPTIFFPDGTILIEPSNDELAEATNTDVDPDQQEFDVIVIGGGPAGLTSAIYTAREGLSTLIIDESGLGGQVAITQVLDNFPGYPDGISGEIFADQMAQQARRFGVVIRQGEEVVDIVRDGDNLHVKSINDRTYTGRAVLIATGSHYKKLGIPGEWDLMGIQVHFCATCDGAFYKDKDVLVVGGGNSGFEEGLFLAETFAKTVKVVEFLPEVRASKILQDRVAQQENMSVVTNHAVQEFLVEDDKLAGVLVEDRDTGEKITWHPDGIFVFIGLQPNTSFLPERIERDQWGFIVTETNFETSMKGVFAAGDVRAGTAKQAVVAAGEGASVALMIRQYLQTLKPTLADKEEPQAVASVS